MTTKFVSHGGWIGADTCMEEGRPWMRPGAAEYIESLLPEGANVFEWGAGASTIWLARRGCAVTSVELDHDWVFTVRAWLAREGLTGNARVFNFSPSNPITLENSADVILSEPDGSFDLVIVDGRNRCRCLANARSKVKVGGILVLDNSERQEYTEAVKLMSSWDGYEFGDEGWATTIFIRGAESDVSYVEFKTEEA